MALRVGSFDVRQARVEQSDYDFNAERSVQPTNLVCPDCGAPMRLVRNRYKRTRTHPNGSPFYGCTRYPECKGSHGAHPDGAPHGRPGTAEERVARKEAHAWFDQLWQGGDRDARREAYAWLRATLPDMPGHISEMNVEQCRATVAAVQARLKVLLAAKWRGAAQGRK